MSCIACFIHNLWKINCQPCLTLSVKLRSSKEPKKFIAALFLPTTTEGFCYLFTTNWANIQNGLSFATSTPRNKEDILSVFWATSQGIFTLQRPSWSIGFTWLSLQARLPNKGSTKYWRISTVGHHHEDAWVQCWEHDTRIRYLVAVNHSLAKINQVILYRKPTLKEPRAHKRVNGIKNAGRLLRRKAQSSKAHLVYYIVEVQMHKKSYW